MGAISERDDAAACVEVARALTEVRGPAAAADGDCLVWEPLVRAALTGHGYPGVRARAIGWLDADATVIIFMHEVTTVGGLVVDFTARQFAEHLPARWIAAREDYRQALAEATGCPSVTLTAG